MAKKKINYANTVIYKICCDDTADFYIGSTTDFTSRKSQHKTNCNNENRTSYNLKIYKTIREYGGWQNWRMVVIEKFPCENRREAEKREEEIRMELKATLNTIRAWTDGKCSVDECKNCSLSGGVCRKHGAKLKRCSVDGCENKSVKCGVCLKHGAEYKSCSVDGCENKSQKDGVCKKHAPQYTCEVCNKTLSIISQKRHEKSKKHLKNLENV